MTNRTFACLLAAVLACPLPAGGAPRERERPARAELPSKPTGAIALEHRTAVPPAVGVPLTIELTARGAAQAAGLAIEASATAPRAVLVTEPALVSAADGVYRWTITVVPLAAEAGYLHVIVSGDVDGVAQAHAVTVSLRSAPAAEAASPAAASAAGDRLIALPVQESR